MFETEVETLRYLPAVCILFGMHFNVTGTFIGRQEVKDSWSNKTVVWIGLLGNLLMMLTFVSVIVLIVIYN